jgi:hypothetical protein
MCLSAVPGSAPLLTLRAETVAAGRLDLEPISLSFQAPAACTRTTDGATRVPSQQTAAQV